MTTPRLSKDELWVKIFQIYRQKDVFFSVVKSHKYTIPSVDELTRTYTIKYEKSKRTKEIPIDDLYAAYEELYRIGRLRRDYLNNKSHCLRLFGHTKYTHAPGATIYAILPKLDEAIHIDEKGHLYICSTS